MRNLITRRMTMDNKGMGLIELLLIIVAAVAVVAVVARLA